MGLRFNPFTSNFDFDSAATATTWLPPVATRASLPSGDSDGAARVVLDEDTVFVYDNAADEWHNTRLTLSAFNATATAAGVSIDSVTASGKVDYRINIHPADSTNPGAVSTTAQSFAGNKTFDDNLIVTGDLTVNGTTTSVNSTTMEVTDANITINNGGTQSSANLADAGITVEMSDATDVQIGYDSTLASRFKIGDVGAEAEIVDASSTQTLTNKNLKSSTNLITGSSADSLDRETGNQNTFTIPDSASNDNFVLEDFTQTLTNKTLDNTNAITVLDNSFTVQDNSDNTKQFQLRADLLTTATTRTFDVPDANTTLVGHDATQTLTNKTIDADSNTITNIEDADIKVAAAIDAAKIADGSVSNAEYQTLDGVTSAIQTQIDGKANQNLGNLTSPTAVNQNLLPGSTEEIGSATSGWAKIIGKELLLTDGAVLTGGIVDTSTGAAHNGILGGRTADVALVNLGVGSDKDLLAGTVDVADTSNTGTVYIQSGDQKGVSGDSGSLRIETGSSTGGNSGVFNAQSGSITSVAGISGSVTVRSGGDSTALATGGTGFSTFGSGVVGASSTSATSGNTTLTSGIVSGGSGKSGDVVVESGNQLGTGNSGDVTVRSGSSTGTRGSIKLDGLSVDLVTAAKITNVVDPTADQDVATKKYVDDSVFYVLGDLDQVSFSMANNQTTLASVTGVAFANGSVRSAEIQYSVAIDATADLFESGKLMIVQRGADWVITQTGNGDNSQVLFNVSTSGQLQYTSGNIAGFVSGTVKCRALVTSV